MPARVVSPRHAITAATTSTGKSPSTGALAGRAWAIGGDEIMGSGRSPPLTLSMKSTGNLRRLASEAEFRAARGDHPPQQPPSLLRGASTGGTAQAAAGLGRAALLRHNSLLQGQGQGDPRDASSPTGTNTSRGSSARGVGIPDPQRHAAYYHTIGPGSTLSGQRGSGTAAALFRVRKLAGAAMGREGSFLTALSLLGGEDSGGSGSAGSGHPPYASPPTNAATAAAWLGSPPYPLRSASIGSSDAGGGGGGMFDASSPPGMPHLLSTSPAPATVIMGPGARAALPPSSYASSAAGGAGFGAGFGGGRGYPGAATATDRRGGGGSAGLGWESVNREMALLIADAREMNELCRCGQSRQVDSSRVESFRCVHTFSHETPLRPGTESTPR